LSAGTVAAKVFSNVFTPFSVAAIVSVVFSWFSPIGIGPLMTPLSSALTGILTLCVLPFVPVVYSARTGRTDLDVSDIRQRAPLYLPGLASYVGGATIFLTLNNKVMFAISFACICVASATFLITLGRLVRIPLGSPARAQHLSLCSVHSFCRSICCHFSWFGRE